MHPSASIYSTLTLRFYDFLVLNLTNSFAWRCPTRTTLLLFYQKHTKEASTHLEIGVGTGYYPSAATSTGALSKTQLITLCDLNPNTLAFAKRRIASAGYKGSIETLEHNAFHPLSQDVRGKYDSVALYYLLHCLPGSFPKKGTDVFATVVPALAPHGVVHGATVLGKGAAHNWLGSRLIWLYNKLSTFGNTADTEEGLRQALGEAFEEWEVTVVGVVALFEARKPKSVKV